MTSLPIRPDDRDQILGGTPLGHYPLLEFIQGLAPKFVVLIDGIRRIIPAEPTELSGLDLDNISLNTMVEVTGEVGIGRKTDHLRGRLIHHLDSDQVEKHKEYVLKPDKDSPTSMPSVQPGKTTSINSLSEVTRAGLSKSAQKAMGILNGDGESAAPEPGSVYLAPVNGAHDTNVHLRKVPAGDEASASATIRAGGSELGTGMGGVGMSAAGVEMSCMPQSVVYSHFAENPLLNSLGPSTTINPFPPYLVNVSRLVLGIYTITKAIGGLPSR